MRVKIKEVGKGLHPNEIMVAVPTLKGEERLVVHRRSLSGHFLEIGYPIAREGDTYLIELPRETMGGLWRVHVNQANLSEEHEREVA